MDDQASGRRLSVSSSSSPIPAEEEAALSTMSGAGANYDYHPHQQPASAEQPAPQMALPSIQHFDAQSQQQQQQQQQPPPPAPQQHYVPPPMPSSYNPSAMHQPMSHAPHSQQHPPPYPPVQYQYHTGAAPPPAPMQSASGQNGMMRYPIQPQASLESRQMSSGHGKKEIKRRTKTGCITCRKRRIKCDEAQPTCRNCQKSKRECLGYDPVFKQTPQPAQIQPAPNPPLHHQQSTAHHLHHQQPPHPQRSPLPPSHPLQQPSQPPLQQQLHQSPSIPNHNNPYQSAPPYPGAGGTFVPGPVASYPTGAQPHQDYLPAPLDPALSTASPQQMAQNNYPPSLQPQRDVKPVSVEELFAVNDVPPRYREGDSSMLQAADFEAIETSFKFHYASGLDRLFETTWYSQRGFAQLREDSELPSYFIQCMEQMSSRDESAGKAAMSMEARLVWLLASLPRTAASRTNGAGLDLLLQELLPRIDAVEHLLTGQFMDPSRVPSHASPPTGQPQGASTANQKYNERSFWHHLAKLVSLRDDQPSGLKEINDSLNAVRAILNMLESRDVLYSLVIGRHIGGRMPGFPQRPLIATSNDPNDEVNKLKVAHGFIGHEEQRGQSQIFQRICSMALRSWMLQRQR